MDSNLFKPKRIDKEKISDLNFPRMEVLNNQKLIQHRQQELERATTLGNIEHNKIIIVFSDSDGLKEVNTTIWATTDSRIVLKGGIIIPINRIHEVRIV